MTCRWVEEPDGKGGTVSYIECSWPRSGPTIREVQDDQAEAPDPEGPDWGA